MTRLGLRCFLSLSLVLGLCISNFAAEKPNTKSPAPAPTQKSQQTNSKKTKAPKALKYRGDISAIDTTTGAVSVKGDAGEKRFMTQDAAKDALEHLAVGDTVRVIYSEKDNKLVASSVRRFKAKQVKATTSKAPESKSTPPQKDSKAKAK
jgi:ribosomal protein S1